jgi:hypothetical protein
MGIIITPLGMNVVQNPITYSPYAMGEGGNDHPIDGQRNLSTESYIFICTEDGTEILTE